MSSLSAASSLVSKLRPLGDRILVKKTEAATTRQVGSIVVPEAAMDKVQQGEVVAVGPGLMGKKGVRIEVSVRPGQKVLLTDFCGQPLKLGNDKYAICREEDILCVLHDD